MIEVSFVWFLKTYTGSEFRIVPLKFSYLRAKLAGACRKLIILVVSFLIELHKRVYAQRTVNPLVVIQLKSKIKDNEPWKLKSRNLETHHAIRPILFYETSHML